MQAFKNIIFLSSGKVFFFFFFFFFFDRSMCYCYVFWPNSFFFFFWQEHVQSKLSMGGSGEAYFSSLYDLYTKTQQLSSKLSQFNLDQSLLPQLTKAIFQTHLQAYSRSGHFLVHFLGILHFCITFITFFMDVTFLLQILHLLHFLWLLHFYYRYYIFYYIFMDITFLFQILHFYYRYYIFFMEAVRII